MAVSKRHRQVGSQCSYRCAGRGLKSIANCGPLAFNYREVKKGGKTRTAVVVVD